MGQQVEREQQPPVPRVLIVQNDVVCPPATAIASLTEHEIPYQVIYAFHDGAFKHVTPQMYEAIIILGGRIGYHTEKEFAWFTAEREFVKDALYNDIPILGICLGCQIIAECCGGKVFNGTKGHEVGYKDWQFHTSDDEKSQESKDDPFVFALKNQHLDKFVVLFHKHTFSLPESYKSKTKEKEVILLASTDKYSTFFRCVFHIPFRIEFFAKCLKPFLVLYK